MSANDKINMLLHELAGLLIELRESHPSAYGYADAIERKGFEIAGCVRELPCVEPAPISEGAG